MFIGVGAKMGHSGIQSCGYDFAFYAMIAEKCLTTGRLTQAVKQIANEDSSVRLGGILGLEQIADVHEEERYKIARVLVSFIRKQAAKDSERAKKIMMKVVCPKLKMEN